LHGLRELALLLVLLGDTCYYALNKSKSMPFCH
jgi:hypothetical protein